MVRGFKIMPGLGPLATLVTLIGCTHATRHGVRTPDGNRAIVRVEEDIAAVPVGTVVHLCIRDLPCVTDTTRASNRSDNQSIDLPLSAGVSAKDANGWRLRAYASAR
jgi:3D (Asp-Asp-Asp) domain-containing protein